MPLAPAATLLARTPEQIATVLDAHGTTQPIIDDELRRMCEHRVTVTANRSVVGIMNEFTFLAKTHRRPDLLDLSLQLATTPCSPLYRRRFSALRPKSSANTFAGALGGDARAERLAPCCRDR